MDKLIGRVNALLQEHAHKRVNGKVASDRTATAAGESLRASFRALWNLGYRLDDPKNLAEKHILALCKHWYETGHAPKTMQGNLSQLRIFARWINKPDFVKGVAYYLPAVPPEKLRVSTVARVSKSWSENGIDVCEKILLADDLDWRFGLMLRMQLAFGLRRMEVIQMKPWKNDMGDKFSAYATKGGRPRDVYIHTVEQRQVLDLVKSRVARGEHLGWPLTSSGKVASLKYAIQRYSHLLPKIGISRDMSIVTGHGLRAQYAENAALVAKMIPPTLGGTGGQMDRGELTTTREQVSELLGHSRVGVTGAYYGSFGRSEKADPPERAKDTISAAVALLPDAHLTRVKAEHFDDCMGLFKEMARLDVAITLPQVQALWQVHSLRHNTQWAGPTKNNAAALEAAALRIQREFTGVTAQGKLNLPM